MNWLPLYLSAKLALVTTCILLVVAMPLAYTLAYKRIPAKPLLDAFFSLPLVLPPTVLGFYLLLFMGPNGGLGRLWNELTGTGLTFTFTGLVLASIVYSFPFAVQPLKNSFEKIDIRLIEAAYVLGCSNLKTFFRVIIPNSINGIIVAGILTFAHTMGEFGVVLMVGGSIPGKTKVASIAIYEFVEALEYKKAAHLSLALIVISYLVLVAVNLLNQRDGYDIRSRSM